MKNQRELVLLVPDEYNKIFSAYRSVKHKNSNNIHKKMFTNVPQATDYQTYITKKSQNRVTLNLRHFPIIDRKNNLFLENDYINNTVNNKSNSLEGFKPIEDNKLRNKFKHKKEKNPLSIKYLSLTEDSNNFDKYFFSLTNNKNISNTNKNKIFFMNNKYLFENNITETKKEYNYNYNYIKKVFNKDKKRFKKYIEEDIPLAKDILTNEILNRVSKFKTPKKNYNINYTNSLYNREDKIKSFIITNYRYENDINVTSSNYLKNEKEKEEYVLPNIKIEKNNNDKEREKQRHLIIHNVFFEWIIDKIIFKYQTNRKYIGYFSLYNKDRLFSRNSIKKLLDEEIENLKKNIFKTEVNNSNGLNLSYDFNADIINKINNIGGLVKKYSKSASQKKNLDKLRKKNNLYIEADNKENLKKKIFNKLIKKIIYKGRNDLLDVKYTNKSNEYKKLNSFVSNINSNKMNISKFIDHNEFRRFNDINKQNRNIKSSKILLDDNIMNYNNNNLDAQNSVEVNMNEKNNNLIYDYFRKKNKIIKNNKIYDDYSKGIFKNYPLNNNNNNTNNNNSQKAFMNKNFDLNLSKIRSKHSIDKTDDSKNNNKNNQLKSPYKKIVSIDDNKTKIIKQKINSLNKNEKQTRNNKQINLDKDTETKTQSFINITSNINKFEEQNSNEIIIKEKSRNKDKDRNREINRVNNKRLSNSTGAKNIFNDQDDKIIKANKDKDNLEQKKRDDNNNKKERNKELNYSKENKKMDKKDRNIIKRNRNRKKTKKTYSKDKSKSKERKSNESMTKSKIKKEEENHANKSKENEEETEEEEISEDKSKEEHSSEDKSKEEKNVKDNKDNNTAKEDKDKRDRKKLTNEFNKKEEKINNEKNNINRNNINDDLKNEKSNSKSNNKNELEQIKESDSEHNSNNRSDHIKDSDSKHKSNEKRSKLEEVDEFELEKSEENSFNETENNKKEKEKEKERKKENKKKKKIKIKKKENLKPVDKEPKDISLEKDINNSLNKSKNVSKRPSLKNHSSFLESFKRPKNKKNNKAGKSSNKSKFSTKKNYPSLPKLKIDKKSSQRRGSVGFLSSAILESLTQRDTNEKKSDDSDNSDNSEINLDKKNNNKEKDKGKEIQNQITDDDKENYKTLNDILNANEKDLDEQEKLVYYALKMQKLNELKDKSEDIIAEGNELKEKYKQIISSYILKQKHKDLTKNKNFKNYERSKIKVKYDEFFPDNNLEEIPSSSRKKKQNVIIRKFSSYSDDENSDEDESESEEFNNSGNGNGSDEKLNKKKSRIKFSNNSQKKLLIYDNSYLFKNKKKDVVIRDEIYKILNNQYDEDKNGNKSEEEESESSSSSESKNGHMRDYKSKFSKKNYLSKNSSLRNKKKKNKKKVNRMTMLEKMSLNYTTGEVEDKTDLDKDKQFFDVNENQHLEHRLKYFFSNIQRLKNTKDENTIENLMKELGVYDIEKKRNRVLSNFFEIIDSFRITNKVSKSKFNFLPPIKFSTNNLSQKKLDE